MTDTGLLGLRDQIEAAGREAASGVAAVEAQAAVSGEPVGRFAPSTAVREMVATMLAELGDVPRNATCSHLSFRRPGVFFWAAWLPGRLLCAECAELATTLVSAGCDVCGEQRGTTWSMVQLGPIVLLFTACQRCLTSG